MRFAHSAFGLAAGVALILCNMAPAVAAPSMTTFPLRGTQMAAMAHGIVDVTAVSPGDYKVVITVSAMPAPASLKTMPVRHAYVAWAFDSSRMHRPTDGQKPKTSAPKKSNRSGNPAAALGTLTAIPLHATNATTYTGTATIKMKQAPGIIVSAEVSASVHAPAMPFWGVLIGTMAQQ